MTRGSASGTETVLSVLRSRAVTFAPGTVLGVGAYVESKQVWAALLACVLWRPAVALSDVIADWIQLLRPPRRWRRPRRRGG